MSDSGRVSGRPTRLQLVTGGARWESYERRRRCGWAGGEVRRGKYDACTVIDAAAAAAAGERDAAERNATIALI